MSGVNHLDLAAILFGLSGVFVLVALRFILRAPALPPTPPEAIPARPCPHLPQRLEAVLAEGFEVVELYNDIVPVTSPTGREDHFFHEPSYERTAKIRDPGSGAVALLRVVTSSRTSR